MADINYSKSSLARHAEKLLANNSLFSDTDRSPDHTRSTSHHRRSQKNTSESDDEPVKMERKFVKKPKKKVVPYQSERSPIQKVRSQSQPKKQKSFSRNKSPVAKPPEHVSSLKDNYSLRIKMTEMKKTLQKKEKKIKQLYNDIFDEREEIRTLSAKAYESKKKDFLMHDLHEKIKNLQQNEMSLMKELGDQQKIAKEALNKLYELQEESVTEIERLKRYYKEFYDKQSTEQRGHYESKIEELQRETESLLSTVKDYESAKNMDKANKSMALSSEIVNLNSQLNMKSMENEHLRAEINDLKQMLKDKDRITNVELENLKVSLDELAEQNRALRTSEDVFSNREIQSRMQQKREIDELERELDIKDDKMREQERSFRDQLDKINEKVQGMHRELRRLPEYEVRIDQLQKELEIKDNEVQLAKKYYKEKLALKKKTQQDQKQEWSNIYNELLGEIRGLKTEIDSLGHENKKLLSSVNSRGLRESYKDDQF